MENAEQEFVSVVREYERVIYKVCYLYTTPNATLNDLYQEVVLNLWKAFPKFRRGQLEKSIILLYLEEKSYEEIAEITGLTLTNVATKLSRIKDKLKKMNKEE